MSDFDPSSYFTARLKVTGGLTRFGLCRPFLKELFNGGDLFFWELSVEEAPPLLLAGNGFCFLVSAELPELSLALRLLVRAMFGRSNRSLGLSEQT